VQHIGAALTDTRYAEGRRYWAQLGLASQTLGRVFWVHCKPKKDQQISEEVRRQHLLQML
jgi:ion channel-forming bestrophin family protein